MARRKSDPVQYLKAAYVLLLLVIFILPFYSLPDYTLLKNTTSHLGAQHTPNAWIMNFTFVALGMTTVFAGWRFLGAFWFHKIALLIFGIALAMTAVFRHAPIDASLPFSAEQDRLHSLFANITGVSFSVFAVSLGLVVRKKWHRILAFAVTILAPALSLLMFYEPTRHLMGVWQRMIFIGMFGWLIYAFTTYQLKNVKS